ncbi:MAG: hypothetical protein H2062_02985 [Synechococcus sp.]|nr:hypothetical protein [Synechococcus sp.]
MIIAIMVMAAFANIANAGGCSYSKSAEGASEQIDNNQTNKKEAEA